MADEPQGQPPQQPDWEQQYRALEQQYRGDMEKVYHVLTQAQQQQQARPAPPEEPQWDTQDPAALKKQFEASLQKTVVDTITPVMTTLAGNQFEANAAILRGDARFPYFGHWEQEIRQLAAQVHPGQLAKMDTLVNIYQLVASRHAPELIEQEVRRRLAAQEAQHPPETDDVEVDDGEETEEEKEKPAPAVPVTPQPPPPAAAPPQRPASVQPARSVRAPQKARLTRDEVYMAERMGLTPKEYWQAKQLGDAEI
jgi:hypothetical protein